MTGYGTLSLAYMRDHPDAAAARLERFAPAQVSAALASAPGGVTAALLARMAPHAAAATLSALPDQVATDALEEMPLHTISLLLRRLPGALRGRLTALLSTRAARGVEALLAFPEHTVGALVDPLVTGLPADTTAADALAHVRLHPEDVDHELFVVGRDHALTGAIALRLLLAAPPGTPLEDLSSPVTTAFAAGADARTLVHSAAWANTHTVPVVDATGAYLGALRYDTVRHVADEAARAALPAATAGAILALNEIMWTSSVRMLVELAGAALSRTSPAGALDGRLN